MLEHAVADAARSDDTKTRLLDAAGEVFAESGYQAATVREICRRAGVNIALINYYFGDKQTLYAQVLRHSFGPMDDELKALDSGLPPAEAVRELIRATMQRIYRPNRPSWHFRLMRHELSQPTPAMDELVERVMRPMYARFRAIIGSMLGFPADEEKTKLCAHSVMSQIVHYTNARAINAKLWPELEMTPERIAQISSHIADFSLAYLEKAAPHTTGWDNDRRKQ